MNKQKLALLLSCTLLLLILTACGGGMEKKLVGTWYREGKNVPAFELYDDGTCKIENEYGTGKWAVVNDNQLKLTNFYGESDVVTIVGVKGGCLTVSAGGSNTTEFYSSPKTSK